MLNINLLFPCCSASVNANKNVKSADKSCCSSLTAHIITSLVLAIIVGAGAATASYFLTQHLIMWTAIAGGSGFVVTGLTTYVALRCCCGQSKSIETRKNKNVVKRNKNLTQTDKAPQSTSTKVQLSTPTKVHKLPEFGNHADLPSQSGLENSSITPKSSSSKSQTNQAQNVYLGQVSYEVKCTRCLTKDRLGQFIDLIDSNFTNETKQRGTVYYDPTNELPIPFVRLYQELLMHPECDGGARDNLLGLLAAELIVLYVSPGGLHPSYLSSLDKETVRALADKNKEMLEALKSSEPSIRRPELRVAQLCSILENYGAANAPSSYDTCGRSTAYFNAARGQKEIVRQLNSEVGEGKYYFGVSLDDGGCLFHTMAQQLSVHFGILITEKTLRMQCHAYMMKLEEVKTRWDVNNDEDELKMMNDESMRPWPANHFYTIKGTSSAGYKKEVEEGQFSSRDILEKLSKEMPSSSSWGETTIHANIIAELYGVTFIVHEALIENVVIREEISYTDEDTGEKIKIPAKYEDWLHESEGQPLKPYNDEDAIRLQDIGGKNLPAKGTAVLRIASLRGHFFPIWTV